MILLCTTRKFSANVTDYVAELYACIIHCVRVILITIETGSTIAESECSLEVLFSKPNTNSVIKDPIGFLDSVTANVFYHQFRVCYSALLLDS